jgi:hypothetical protein
MQIIGGMRWYRTYVTEPSYEQDFSSALSPDTADPLGDVVAEVVSVVLGEVVMSCETTPLIATPTRNTSRVLLTMPAR